MPAKQGDVLIASAEERSRGNRTGIYDITITNQDKQVVAYFRGKSYQVRGSVRRLEE
jgi:acyl-CoA thioesterase